jgi:hypothetical protein
VRVVRISEEDGIPGPEKDADGISVHPFPTLGRLFPVFHLLDGLMLELRRDKSVVVFLSNLDISLFSPLPVSTLTAQQESCK